MTAKDIMTTRVITVTPTTSVRQVAQLLVQHRIGAVPVVAPDGRLVGIVGESNLLCRVETGTERHRTGWLSLLAVGEERAHDYVKAHGTRADDVMSREFVTVPSQVSIEAIARLLEKHHTRRVLVVQDGRLVGIVTRSDLVRGVARAPARPKEAPVADDTTIQQQVAHALRSAGCATAICTNIQEVTVKDGVVELRGWVEGDEVERAACIAASSVPGVRAVEDHLVRLPAHVWAE